MRSIGEDKLVIRRNVSWTELERFLDRKGDDVVPRVAYLDGVLELVTPSRGHEKQGAWIGALVATYAVERGIELSSFRSWLLTDKLNKAGAEPDDCYIVGADPEEKLTRPHFVIEVQWSRPATHKLEIYRRLGVREVWFWAKSNRIAVHVLKRGTWSVVECSPCLPDLDLALLCSFLDRRSMTRAMLDFRAALRRP